MGDNANHQPSKFPAREEGRLSMAKKRKPNIEQEQAVVKSIVDAMPEGLNGLSFLGVMKFGAQEILKHAVIAEINEFLGTNPYDRLPNGAAPKGERNGFRETVVDTPVGQVTYDRQRLVNADGFKSKIHTPYMRRPEEFATAVTEMYVQGVSTRKVKRALKAVTGEKTRLSRSTVSRITEKLREEFRQWQTRSLKGKKVVYLFLDAIRIGIRFENTAKQAVLLAYGVMEDGTFELLSVGLGHSEADKTWGKFLSDLKVRGLMDPLLAVSDGNHGVIAAIDSNFPSAYRQRCVKHKVDNILDAVPKERHDEVRPKINRIFYGATSLEQAKDAIQSFKKEYAKIFPSAVNRLENDLDQALTFFLFPATHWKRIRTSNRLERLNKEIRRRLKVIGRHPSEDGCLSLVYATSTRYAADKNGFKSNDIVKALWTRLREQKQEMLTQLELAFEAA
jgi:transposase-like protein